MNQNSINFEKTSDYRKQKHIGEHKEHKPPLIVKILVYENENDNDPIRVFQKRWSRESRDWLLRMIVWATSNNKYVIIENWGNGTKT